MIIVLIGVSGSGKTTIGKLLADKMGFPFYDADDFHPKKNILKMTNNEALNDDDREPWLVCLSDLIETWQNNKGAILACSALKESYRLLLSKKVSDIKWVYLNGTKDIIAERMQNRKNHFFKPQLLDSQFEILEEPNYGLHVDITQNIKEILNQLTNEFK